MSERPIIYNTYSDRRYTSTPMLQVFSPVNKVIHERELWIAIMKGQKSLGFPIPDDAIAAYESVKDRVNLESIRQREEDLLHDAKARVEEFNELAGYQFAHLGLTTRDITDNVEQWQIKQGLLLIRERAVATLVRLARLATEQNALVYADRTHNAIAQSSLIGKLFSSAGEETLIGFDKLETLIKNYPLRGIKGAIGTQTDQLQLLGDQAKVDALEQKIAEYLGFEKVLGSIGQIYPRSLDFEVISNLFQLVSGISSLATTMRLLAGNEHFNEGFKEGQVGSTAMPYKMNTRSCERIISFKHALQGYLTMATCIAGEQWYSGDVSCSVVRREAISNSFFATDGIFQTMLTVLDECGFYPAVINREVERYLPFLTATRWLTAAVEQGVGREMAHKIIKEHALAVALEIREKGMQENNLLDRLAEDKRFKVPRAKLEEAIASPILFVGSAPRQIIDFVARVEKVTEKYPEAVAYIPEKIL